MGDAEEPGNFAIQAGGFIGGHEADAPWNQNPNHLAGNKALCVAKIFLIATS